MRVDLGCEYIFLVKYKIRSAGKSQNLILHEQDYSNCLKVIHVIQLTKVNKKLHQGQLSQLLNLQPNTKTLLRFENEIIIPQAQDGVLTRMLCYHTAR